MIRFWLFALLLGVVSCSHLSPRPQVATRVYHPQIELAGRISIQYAKNNRPQAVQMNFNWSQTSQQTIVTLSSLTGQTLAELVMDAHGAQLKQARQPLQFASDANQLLFDLLGWPLPVTNLNDWLQGFIDSRVITKANSMDTFFIADGWSLAFPSWEYSENSERPKRLDLTRQTEQAGQVSLRIAIDQWKAQ